MKLTQIVDEIRKKKKKRSRLPIIRRRHYGWGFMPWVSNTQASQAIGGDSGGDAVGGDAGGGDAGGGGGDGGGGGMEENISAPYIYKIETDDDNFNGDKFDKVADFSKFTVGKLGIKSPFNVTLTQDREGNGLKTLAHFDNSNSNCCVYTKDRNLADILRSIAHELVHKSQFEKDQIKAPVQDIGGPIEDEANAVAGQLVKEFGYANEDIFE